MQFYLFESKKLISLFIILKYHYMKLSERNEKGMEIIIL